MEFGYLNSIRKSAIIIFVEFPTLVWSCVANSVSDVPVVSGQHGVYKSRHFKCGENICPYILHKKNCSDLNLGGSLCIFTFLSFPRLWVLSIERF